MLKGIDVSEHQGVIDWDSVKSQIDYAILRCGYGDNTSSQDDRQFIRNANECVRLGIPFGVYIYSYATSIQQARSEAEHVLRLIKGYKLSYPVYYDLEDSDTTGQCSNSFIGNMAETFADIIQSNGYWCGMYASTYWWNSKLTDIRFNNWVKWVAQYASNCTYGGSYDMWQYASDDRINGVSGNVDVNYCYVDYPSRINESENKEEDIDMGTIVVYMNDIDKRGAEMVADKLHCCQIDGRRTPFDYSKYSEVICVGGEKDQYTCYCTKHISGDNRYSTLDEVVNYIKSL